MRTSKENSETYWWIRPEKNGSAFDEDANNRRASVDNVFSSSIDTSTIDGFRQGIEIQTWKHWTQGTVKISAGSEGHEVKPENYGTRDVSLYESTFNDSGKAIPSVVLNASNGVAHKTSYLLPAWPPISLTREQAFRHLYDGVLDALDVRRIEHTLGENIPLEGKGVRGCLMAGNEDEQQRSDLVVSYIEPVNSSSFPPYKDSPEIYGKRWINDRTRLDSSTIVAFIDRNVYINDEQYPTDPEIAAVVNVTSGSGGFLPIGTRASTSGWVYDDGIGTDSISFGGLTY